MQARTDLSNIAEVPTDLSPREEWFFRFLSLSHLPARFKPLPSTQRAFITVIEQVLYKIHSGFSAVNLALLLQIPKGGIVPAFSHPQLTASRLRAYLSHDDWPEAPTWPSRGASGMFREDKFH